MAAVSTFGPKVAGLIRQDWRRFSLRVPLPAQFKIFVWISVAYLILRNIIVNGFAAAILGLVIATALAFGVIWLLNWRRSKRPATITTSAAEDPLRTSISSKWTYSWPLGLLIFYFTVLGYAVVSDIVWLLS